MNAVLWVQRVSRVFPGPHELNILIPSKARKATLVYPVRMVKRAFRDRLVIVDSLENLDRWENLYVQFKKNYVSVNLLD